MDKNALVFPLLLDHIKISLAPFWQFEIYRVLYLINTGLKIYKWKRDNHFFANLLSIFNNQG